MNKLFNIISDQLKTWFQLKLKLIKLSLVSITFFKFKKEIEIICSFKKLKEDVNKLDLIELPCDCA